MSRRRSVFRIWFLLIAWLPLSCLYSTPQYNMLRLQASDSLALMATAPFGLTLSRPYDAIDEVGLESATIPVRFEGLEKEFVDQVALHLQQASSRLNIVDRLEGGACVQVLKEDPRRQGLAGYALLEPKKPPAPQPRKWTPQWEEEQKKIQSMAVKNDRRPDFWLLAADVPWGNATRRSYLRLEPERLRSRTPAKYLLLIGLDGILVVDRARGPEISATFRTRLIRLADGAMPAELIRTFPLAIEGAMDPASLFPDNTPRLSKALADLAPAVAADILDWITRTSEGIEKRKRPSAVAQGPRQAPSPANQ